LGAPYCTPRNSISRQLTPRYCGFAIGNEIASADMFPNGVWEREQVCIKFNLVWVNFPPLAAGFFIFALKRKSGLDNIQTGF
jgi:hypothetical protein